MDFFYNPGVCDTLSHVNNWNEKKHTTKRISTGKRINTMCLRLRGRRGKQDVLACQVSDRDFMTLSLHGTKCCCCCWMAEHLSLSWQPRGRAHRTSVPPIAPVCGGVDPAELSINWCVPVAAAPLALAVWLTDALWERADFAPVCVPSYSWYSMVQGRF